MKYTYEAKATIPPGSRTIALFDPTADDGWPRVISSNARDESKLEVGAHYRVTIEKLRAPLAPGFEWWDRAAGVAIRTTTPGSRSYWVVNEARTGVLPRGDAMHVPPAAFDGFRAEGML